MQEIETQLQEYYELCKHVANSRLEVKVNKMIRYLGGMEKVDKMMRLLGR